MSVLKKQFKVSFSFDSEKEAREFKKNHVEESKIECEIKLFNFGLFYYMHEV